MDERVKMKWVAALRSGRYKQGRKVLALTDPEEFCCLGVLCELALKEGVIDPPNLTQVTVTGFDGETRKRTVRQYGTEHAVPPKAVLLWAGLTDQSPGDSTGRTLAAHNDAGETFAEIADLIERDL